MEYKEFFSPGDIAVFNSETSTGPGAGDRRDGSVYVYSPEIVLAVRVAQATNRPLLIRGGPGNGKSSLARNVARLLKWRFYEVVITSRTQARDLLWEVDLLHRLSDANLKDKDVGDDIAPYIKPGVLWWAFDPESAKRRGKKDASNDPSRVPDPNLGDAGPRAVVLIDEIDKADPDVPNNLLVPLGSLQFQVEETGAPSAPIKTDAEHAPLVFITTNGERELPAAFVRRCIDVELRDPDVDRLVTIGKAHFPKQTEDFIRTIADAIEERRESSAAKPQFRVGTAEFLDAVRACVELQVGPGSANWDKLLAMTVLKNRVPEQAVANQ